ncbi:MAG: TonB-dependent receptor [Sulfurimonas sp.]|nr:TonB-dependent receptor [Sulfurimonas sp.]
MDAYEKKSIMAKVFVNVTDKQELRLSVTANRSDNILYPNSKMDALYDDSNIYSVEYNIKDLSDAYKNLNIQYYYSDVDHPMATNYRKSSAGALPDIKNWLTTEMQGIKLKNTFDVFNSNVIVGLDGSKRIWDGHYEKDNLPFVVGGRKSIDNAVTENKAIFASLSKDIGAFNISAGLRYDSTDITTDDVTQQDNNYNGMNANIVTTYNINKEHKIFLGIGQANRVPDARELYFRSSLNNVVGTDNLDQTTNREIDLGYELENSMYKAKIKTFYSRLSNYVYIEKGVGSSAFQNIDAIVYGLELSAEYFASDDIIVDFGAAYKRGKKDEALAGQTNTNLADMAPLRGTVGVTYEYANNSTLRAEVQASDTWDTIDNDNGEQVIDSWTLLNLKAKHAFTKNIELTLGVNNVFDQTYATSNTYADLVLLTSGGPDIMLMNDPGRYFYTNLSYKF